MERIRETASLMLIAILVLSSVGTSLGMSVVSSTSEQVQEEMFTTVEAGSDDVPTWMVGSSWTYYEETWINSTEGNVNWIRLEERINYTVSSIEYVDVGGVMTPVYRVTMNGDILGGNGNTRHVLGSTSFVVHEGTTSGYILYRMDDLGIIEERKYRDMEGECGLTNPRFELRMLRTVTHEPNVENYDFPLTPERHFWANNTVFTVGFNHVIVGAWTNNNATVNREHNLERIVTVSDSNAIVEVGEGSYDCYVIEESRIGDDPGSSTLYYNGNVQNNVKVYADYTNEDWHKTLESYYLPTNPNTMSIEPVIAYSGTTATLTGSFPDHALASFIINIPMADFTQPVETNTSGDFSTEVIVPHATDNTPSPGVTGSLGVIARLDGYDTPYQVVTITILPAPDYIVIEPSDKSIVSGDTVTYTATAYDIDGMELMDVTEDTTWSIEAGAGGNWDGNHYTSENPGTWVVTANYSFAEGVYVTDTAELAVSVPGYIEIQPQIREAVGGEIVHYTATAFDSDGLEIRDVTEETVWSIDPAAGGTWNQLTGSYTTQFEGDWTVTGNYTYGGVSYLDDASLSVVELGFFAVEPSISRVNAGESVTYKARLFGTGGEVIRDVSDEAIWSIDTEAGGEWDRNVYTSEFAGEWTVTCTYVLEGLILSDTATLIVEYTADVPTWIVGTSWTYFQDANAFFEMEGGQGTIEAEISMEERLTYTVTSIEHMELQGISTPVYNVTLVGDILRGSGYADTPAFGTIPITITDGYTHGYILYRMDDLGILVDYYYQYVDGYARAFGMNINLDVYREQMDIHLCNVEEYDFPLVSGNTFVANNTVNSTGFNRVVIANNDETRPFNETQNHTRTVQVSEDLELITVPAGTFETFNIFQDEFVNETEGFQIRNYSPEVQNYVREEVDRTTINWIRVLEEFSIPANANHLTIEPSEAFVDETVMVKGSFPDHPEEEFSILIPMADFSDTVNTDGLGNFSFEMAVPHQEDYTPSPGNLGTLGVIAWQEGPQEIYHTATLTILNYPDHIVVEPQTRTVIAGDVVTYKATAYDEHGWPITDVTEQVQWSIDPGAGGLWNQTLGTYFSENPGIWTVRAVLNYGGDELVDEAELKVSVPDHIIVEPDGWIAIAGETVAYTATAYDEFGEVIRDITGETFWTIDPGAMGTWVGNQYTTETSGTWAVTGMYNYDGVVLNHTVTLTVGTPHHVEIFPKDHTAVAGDTIPFITRVYDESNAYIGDVTGDTLWEITPSAGGSWAPSSGDYTSEVAGHWIVYATYVHNGNEMKDNTSLEITPGGVYHIQISPETSTITAGNSQIYNATAFDEFNNEIGDVTGDTNWFTDPGADGTWVDNVYTSELAGTWTITGEHLGVNGTATLTVHHAEVHTVTIFPTEDQTVNAGVDFMFSAEARDLYGNLITDSATAFNWVNATNGVFNRETVGTYHVSASYGDISSSITNVTVVPANPNYVTIIPEDPVTVIAGENFSFAVGLYDAFGNLITDDVTEFIWQGADENGVFNQVTVGYYFVNASYLDITSPSVNVTVVAAGTHNVHIDPDTNQTVIAGNEIFFSVSAYDEFGNLITDNVTDFAWENAVDGVFYEETAGVYHVTATYDNVTSTATVVTVVPAGVHRVEIDPDTHQLVTAGVDFQIVAMAYDVYDNLITDTPSDFDWYGTDENGIFNRQSVGDYSVNARYGVITSITITLTVIPAEAHSVTVTPGGSQTITAGDTIDFSAAAYDAFNNLVDDDDRNFTWYNANETGFFSESRVGLYEVNATYNGITSPNVMVMVVPSSIKEVIIYPVDEVTVIAGEDFDFGAEAYDDEDNLITDDPSLFTWRADDVIFQNGVFNREMVGVYSVVAEYHGVLSPATMVTVVPAPVHTVTINPGEAASVAAGVDLQFSADARDAYGNLITNEITDFTWDNTDTNGIFNKEIVGEYGVTATYGEITSPITIVTVVPAGVDYVIITPGGTVTVSAGENFEFSAEAYDEFGNLITDEPTQFTWENTDVNGVFYKENVGSYSVTARYGTPSITSQPTTVIVEPSGVYRVQISPALDRTVDAGETIQFSAEAHDEFNNLITDSNVDFTWAYADENGVFGQTIAGEYHVTATYGEVTSSATPVIVKPASVAVVSIFTDKTEITAGYNLQFFAEAQDEFGNLITDVITDFTWTHANLNGVLNKETSGRYTVTASLRGISSESVEITVVPADVHVVNIIPSTDLTVAAGVDLEFSAEALDQYGNLIEDDPAGFTWANATDGIFQEMMIGNYDVTATYDGVTSSSVRITVEKSNFEISILSYKPTTIRRGDLVSIEYTVVNTGGLEGTQDIILKVNGVPVRVHVLQLDPDFEFTGEFTWEPDEQGDYALEIGSDDTSEILELTVERQPIMRMRPAVAVFGIILLIIFIAIILVLLKKKDSGIEETYDDEEVLVEELSKLDEMYGSEEESISETPKGPKVMKAKSKGPEETPVAEDPKDKLTSYRDRLKEMNANMEENIPDE